MSKVEHKHIASELRGTVEPPARIRRPRVANKGNFMVPHAVPTSAGAVEQAEPMSSKAHPCRELGIRLDDSSGNDSMIVVFMIKDGPPEGDPKICYSAVDDDLNWSYDSLADAEKGSFFLSSFIQNSRISQA